MEKSLKGGYSFTPLYVIITKYLDEIASA